jgi:hypothetical protein
VVVGHHQPLLFVSLKVDWSVDAFRVRLAWLVKFETVKAGHDIPPIPRKVKT